MPILLYRAVSTAEYNSLNENGLFQTTLNTLEGKQFFKSQHAVDIFVKIATERRYRPPYRHRIVVVIDEDRLQEMYHDDLMLDGYEAISIPEAHLKNFNNNITFELDGHY